MIVGVSSSQGLCSIISKHRVGILTRLSESSQYSNEKVGIIRSSLLHPHQSLQQQVGGKKEDSYGFLLLNNPDVYL